MLKIPYVGAGVVASANGMDKVYSKIIFEKAKIPQTSKVSIWETSTSCASYWE